MFFRGILRTFIAGSGLLLLAFPYFSLAVPDTRYSKRIANPRVFDPAFVSYVASLEVNRDNKTFYCSGTIISDKSIVTSAYCLVNSDKTVVGNNSVIVGYGDGERGKLFKAQSTNVVVHPNYKTFKGIDINYDIGIVTVPDKTLSTAGGNQLKIYKGPIEDDADYILAGWGTIDPNDTSKYKQLKAHVLGGTARLGSDSECKKGLPEFTTQHGSHMCTAIQADFPSGICTGDDGSGIFKYTPDGTWWLVGVESSSNLARGKKSCGEPGALSYFTKIGPFIEYFENIKV